MLYLGQLFEKSFKIPLPERFLPKDRLKLLYREFPGGPGLGGHPLFGTEIAEGWTYLDIASVGPFMSKCPEGYLLVGFWGYGINSYAFYYCRVDDWSRVYFRLPFGGGYMDNDKNARQIRDFLPAYLDFEDEVRSRVSTLKIVIAMGGGWCEIEAAGETVRHEGSFLDDPGALRDLLNKLPDN